jgi:hypothetical protein
MVFVAVAAEFTQSYRNRMHDAKYVGISGGHAAGASVGTKLAATFLLATPTAFRGTSGWLSYGLRPDALTFP